MSEREGWEGRDQYLKTHFVDIFFLNMKNRDKKKPIGIQIETAYFQSLPNQAGSHFSKTLNTQKTTDHHQQSSERNQASQSKSI